MIWVSGSIGYPVQNDIRYPVESGRIAYPVLSGTLLNGKESKLTLIKSRSRYDFKHAYNMHTCILQRGLKVKVKLKSNGGTIIRYLIFLLVERTRSQ